ncbi:MAG: hypothetical protein KA383_09705 [Phycisphaerae bacterium]|nr:hypothetical protein [Phycisphaerae bacterium]
MKHHRMGSRLWVGSGLMVALLALCLGVGLVEDAAPAEQPAADVARFDDPADAVEPVADEDDDTWLPAMDRSPSIYSNSGDPDDPFMLTLVGGACSGRDASEVQTTLGLQAAGFNCVATIPNTVADDFVVPAGKTWTIDQVVFYMYRTNATTPNIDTVKLRLQTENPLGGTVPALMPYTPANTMTMVYKPDDSDPANCNRRVQQCIVTLDTPYVAAAGTHYLIWQASGPGTASGPWVPPIVVPGAVQKPGANALQAMNSSGGVFNLLKDPGPAHYQQDLVFVLRGTVQSAVGDLDCDGTVGFGDINPFVLYLANYPVWEATYVGCPPANGDIDGDGNYPSFGDINPFVTLLTNLP